MGAEAAPTGSAPMRGTRGDFQMRLFTAARREEGASAVEFALVALVLVTLLLGITQFGFTLFQYLEIVHAAREGARWASLGVQPGSVGDPDSVLGRTAAAAPGLNPGLGNGNIAVSEESVGGVGAVTVTVTYDSPIFAPLIGALADGDVLHLQSSATLRMEDDGS